MSDVILKGQKAKDILESDVFREAVQTAEDAITQEWREGKSPTDRESAHAKLRALTEVVRQLRIMMGQGEYEHARLTREERASAYRRR